MKHILYAFIGLLFALISIGPFSYAGRADEQDRQSIDDPTIEIFTGGMATSNSWISWAGGVKSLSSSLYDEGWRVRVLGAYGHYDFTTGNQPNSANPTLFEVMAGYQFKAGPVISRLYIGLHGEHHELDRPDPGNEVAGMGYGFKTLSENWINLPMNSFASLDGAFSTLNTSYQGMLRVGTAKYIERLSLGPEVSIVGNEEYYQLRFGGFARWKLESGQIEGSAGYTRDYDEKGSPYVSVSWLKRF